MTSTEDGEFDAVAWMERLERGRFEHQQIVQRRPSASEVSAALTSLGEHFYEWTDISRRVACFEAGEDPEQTYRWVPGEGSIAASDSEGLVAPVQLFCDSSDRASMHWLDTNPTRNPTDWGIDFLARCIRTTVESLTAIGVLVYTGSHLRAPLILARSCIEATAIACHLIDPDVDSRERTRRILNLHMAQAKESLLEAASAGDDAADELTELQELMDFVQHLGYELARYKPDSWQPPIIKSDGNVSRDPIGAVIDLVLPSVGRSIWRSLSAVAHSRDAQTMMPDEYVLPHKLKHWQRTEVVARHVLPAILVLQELCQRLARYLGWPFDEVDELLVAISQQLCLAAGMGDLWMREQLGLPPITP